MTYGDYIVQAETETDTKACTYEQVQCPKWWDMWQQYAYMQLSSASKNGQIAFFSSNPIQRAKTIAGIYARFYLEQEKYGNPKLKGRYYWMGLGAFASKTVAFSFMAWQTEFDADATRILAAGNFWLFMDVSPWHWGYNQCEQSFNKCFEKRDYSDLAKVQPKVAAAIRKFINLFEEPNALKEISYFKTRKGSYLMKSFEYLQQVEMLMKKKQTGSQDKLIDEKIRQAQFKHLIKLANHEQRIVLQPLCWNKPKLRSAMKLMRNPFVSVFTPDLKLVLTERQNSQDSRFVSTPVDKEVLEKMPRIKQLSKSSNQHIQYTPSGPMPFEVENVEHRMIWITEAARKYHRLMKEQPEKIHASLKALAGWYSDKVTPKA